MKKFIKRLILLLIILGCLIGIYYYKDETVKQILEKIENMSHQDRNEFLFKLKYSEQEIQAINLYYEKLNKSKSKLKDDIPEKPKDEDIVDFSKENYDEAMDNLLKLLEESEQKQRVELN